MRFLATHYRRPFLALLFMGLLVCVSHGSLAFSWTRPTAPSRLATEAEPWPVRDFLPPMATINPQLPTESAQSTVDENSVGPANPNSELEVVSLAAVTTPVFTTRPAITRLESSLGANEDDASRALAALQQGIEDDDLKALWDATVERNAVIRFSLEKLSAPDETLQTKQSSVFLRRTLSTMISGATMASMMLPGGNVVGGYRNMGIMAGGDALRNLTSGATQPQGQRLSATEKIQLAGLVESLQRDVLQHYHDYKRTLSALTLAHEKTTLAQQAYTQAMAVGKQQSNSPATPLMLMSNGAAYYQARLYETTLQQEAQRLRLSLERMAGGNVVTGLRLIANPNTPTETASSERSSDPEPTSSGTLTTVTPVDTQKGSI
ncbi:MAG: hypothetical protein QE263_09155 [Vampirovibrionales bacterium]|nr:hypothetical protein [Vampirovibrionales bacterium]